MSDTLLHMALVPGPVGTEVVRAPPVMKYLRPCPRGGSMPAKFLYFGEAVDVTEEVWEKIKNEEIEWKHEHPDD